MMKKKTTSNKCPTIKLNIVESWGPCVDGFHHCFYFIIECLGFRAIAGVFTVLY